MRQSVFPDAVTTVFYGRLPLTKHLKKHIVISAGNLKTFLDRRLSSDIVSVKMYYLKCMR